MYTWTLWQVSPLLQHFSHVHVILHVSAAFYLGMSTIQHCTVVSISMSVTIVHVRQTLTASTPRGPMNAYLKKAQEMIRAKLTMHAKLWKGLSLSNTTISLFLTT